MLEDTEISDSAHHKSIRKLTAEPLDTLDNKKFTEKEILAVLEKFHPRKEPGEDSLNSDVIKRFPTFLRDIQ
jgi:hypothetical protein